LENAVLAFEPMRRIVPTTRTRITASITAYSAMSLACLIRPELKDGLAYVHPPSITTRDRKMVRQFAGANRQIF
jgi:hypothetical protein